MISEMTQGLFWQREYRGLSTDSKPTDAVNGSTFLEMDTGKVFIYDEQNAQWREL